MCIVYLAKKQQFKGAGVTNLQRPGSLQSLPYKDTKLQAWTLALQTYNHTKIQQSKGRRWRHHARNTRVHGWTLVLQTYSVIEISNSIVQRYKISRVDIGVTNLQYLTVCFKLANVYHTKIHKFKDGRWR